MAKIIDNISFKFLKIDPSDDLKKARKLYDDNNPIEIYLDGEFDNEFLNDFKNNFLDLTSITILNYGTGNYDFLYDLKKLEKINFVSLLDEIDFGKMPQLTELGLSWVKSKIKGLDYLKKLRHMGVSEFKEDDFSEISSLSSLKSLSIATAKCKTLNGIEKLVNLEALSIGAFRGLTDISAISKLNKLRYLEFDICPKMQNFSPLGKLQDLEILELLDCKNLESIQFVKDMKKLEQLSLLGTTVVNDYDLSPATDVARVYGGFGKKYNLDLREKAIPNGRRSFKGYIKTSIENDNI